MLGSLFKSFRRRWIVVQADIISRSQHARITDNYKVELTDALGNYQCFEIPYGTQAKYGAWHQFRAILTHEDEKYVEVEIPMRLRIKRERTSPYPAPKGTK